MASIGEALDIIGIMLENDGVYPGDPQAYELSSYKNNWGSRTFHIAIRPQDVINLWTSPNCHEIISLWRSDSGLTIEGKEVLSQYRRAKHAH